MKLKKIALGNKGTTLVEVTAGFLMMAVVLASFIKIIKLSSEMTTAAVDTKKNNLEFEEKYYQGYNYKVGSDTAFRSDMTVKDTSGNELEITLSEWHKQTDGDYYVEWHEHTDGLFKRFKSDGTLLENVSEDNLNTIKVDSIKLQRIENIRDLDMARKCIYRYKFTPKTTN